MTVFTVEVAARRSSGFTIDSLIGKEKDGGTTERPARNKSVVESSRPFVRESPGPRVHRPTPLVSATIGRPKGDCSPCSALNLSVSGALESGQHERTSLLNTKPNCDSRTSDATTSFGLSYVDALAPPMVVRRGLPLPSAPNAHLWAHYSPELQRNLSLNGTLFGRTVPFRPSLPFPPGPGVVPFHPGLIGPPRDLFHPYHWNVRNQEGLSLPHLAGKLLTKTHVSREQGTGKTTYSINIFEGFILISFCFTD